MSCGNVPIRLSGFNSQENGCLSLVATALGAKLANLVIASTNSTLTTGIEIQQVAYLGAKCIQVACAPVINLRGDSLADLIAFLDANLTQAIPSNLNLTSFTDATSGATWLKAGISKTIAGCCCAC